MKYAVILVLCLAAAANAQDVDPGRLLSDLTLANAAKEVTVIDGLLADIIKFAQTSKDQQMIDTMAAELAGSPKACKGNYGTLKKVMTALGELRSKDGMKALKKYAFVKKPKNEDMEGVQAEALLAIGKYAETKNINSIGEMCKSKSKTVAKGAYGAFAAYGTANAKQRKRCAEIIMKRLEAEKPSSGGQGGKTVSAEKQERWQELQPIIVGSMQAICHEATINDVENWREWWKENKRKKWKDD